MTSLLSIILSLILALSGAGVSTAPEATGYTVSNIVMEVNGERLEFGPELKFSTFVSSDGVALTGHIESEGNVLLPIALQLDGQNIAVDFPNSGYGYRVSNDTLESLIPGFATDELRSLAPTLITAIEDFNALASDPEKFGTLCVAGANALFAAGTENVRAYSVEIDGKHYEGVELELTMNGRNIIEFLKGFDTAGVAEYDSLSAASATLLNSFVGTNYASISDILSTAVGAEDVLDGQELVLNMKRVGEDDVTYIELSCNTEMDGVMLEAKTVELLVGGDLSLTEDICAYNETAKATASIAVNGSDLFGDSPVLNVVLDVSGANAADTTREGSVKNPFMDNQEIEYTDVLIDGHFVINFATVDGLEQTDVNIEFKDSIMDERNLKFVGSEHETREADGSITKHIEADTDLGYLGKSYFSCDINRAEADYAAPIDLAKTKELTAEMLNGDDANMQAITTELRIVLLTMETELTRLTQDPSIAPLVSDLMNS